MVNVDPPTPESDLGVRRHITAYLNVPVYRAFHEWLGRGQALGPMWDAWARGDRKAAVAAVPDEVARDLILGGSMAEIRAHVRRYMAAGVDTAFLSLSTFEPDPARQRDILAEAWRALAPIRLTLRDSPCSSPPSASWLRAPSPPIALSQRLRPVHFRHVPRRGRDRHRTRRIRRGQVAVGDLGHLRGDRHAGPGRARTAADRPRLCATSPRLELCYNGSRDYATRQGRTFRPSGAAASRCPRSAASTSRCGICWTVLGVPVSRLWRPVRDRVPTYASGGWAPSAASARSWPVRRAPPSRRVKLRVGLQDRRGFGARVHESAGDARPTSASWSIAHGRGACARPSASRAR